MDSLRDAQCLFNKEESIASNLNTLNKKDINLEGEIYDLINHNKSSLQLLNFNSLFEYNNWMKEKLTSGILYLINQKGAAVWINGKGDICYRLNMSGAIFIATTTNKINIIFSNLLDREISFLTKIRPKDTSVEEDYNNIYINDLIIVETDKFSGSCHSEFCKQSNTYYRNTFRPSNYLKSITNPSFSYSIILNYINHLANYDPDRFEFIMHWIALLVRQRIRSPKTLILVGDESKGITFLYDNIIKPILGSHYCIKIADSFFQNKTYSRDIKNKLIYNFNNISDEIFYDDNNIDFIDALVNGKKLYANDCNTVEPIEINGEILITMNKISIPQYFEKNYIIYKVDNDISSMVVDKELYEMNNIGQLLQKDIGNFINYLLYYYKGNHNIINRDKRADDRNSLELTLEDKLKCFVDAILCKKITFFKKIEGVDISLFESLKEDFNNNKVIQKNLFKSFKIIYPHEDINSSKTFMLKLRNINDKCFNTSKIKSGSGGIKYFNI